jgi:hypothetical protein
VIIDLRDYTTTPGSRDALIERCETLLFPEQVRLGATFLGSFRDADDPDRFVWLRGMPDLETRARILTAFYTDGEMWKANRAEANAWIADSDNVLLVRPIAPAAAAGDATEVGMYTHLEAAPLTLQASAELQRSVGEAIAAAGGRLLLAVATDPAENNYPRHAIRTGEHGLVWFASYRPLGLAGITERRLVPTAHSRMR